MNLVLCYAICGFSHHGTFFCFYQNGVVVKKITNMGQVVSIWHDFICRSRAKLVRLCHVSLKSCQLGTTCHVNLKSCQVGTTLSTSFFF